MTHCSNVKHLIRRVPFYVQFCILLIRERENSVYLKKSYVHLPLSSHAVSIYIYIYIFKSAWLQGIPSYCSQCIFVIPPSNLWSLSAFCLILRMGSSCVAVVYIPLIFTWKYIRYWLICRPGRNLLMCGVSKRSNGAAWKPYLCTWSSWAFSRPGPNDTYWHELQMLNRVSSHPNVLLYATFYSL